MHASKSINGMRCTVQYANVDTGVRSVWISEHYLVSLGTQMIFLLKVWYINMVHEIASVTQKAKLAQ